MAKQDYLTRQNQMKQGMLNVGERLGMQKMLDYMYIALHEMDGYAAVRCQRLFDRVKTLADEFGDAFQDGVEADYVQEQLDRRLREAIGAEMLPFRERYPELKEIRYDKPKKGWVK